MMICSDASTQKAKEIGAAVMEVLVAALARSCCWPRYTADTGAAKDLGHFLHGQALHSQLPTYVLRPRLLVPAAVHTACFVSIQLRQANIVQLLQSRVVAQLLSHFLSSLLVSGSQASQVILRHVRWEPAGVVVPYL